MEDKQKPIHVSIVLTGEGDEEGTRVSWYFKDATVEQLSLINHELDLMKMEILSRLKDAPKDWDIEDWGEEVPEDKV